MSLISSVFPPRPVTPSPTTPPGQASSPTPTPEPTPTPAPSPSPTPAPAPAPTPTPTTSPVATPVVRRVRVDPYVAPTRQWGEAGTLSISASALRAERLLKVDFAVGDKPAPLEPAAAGRTAVDILRDAARSLVAQANVERQGAVSLLIE